MDDRPELPEEHGILEIDSTRLGQLRAVAEYVQGIHHNIDPDRFRIDEERLRWILDGLVARDHEPARLRVTYRDLLFLQTLIDAAETYAARPSFPALDAVEGDDLDDLLGWLGQRENALFRKPPTIH
jgi:hypothetical protein